MASLGVLTDGWGVSVVDVQQSGYPMTVLTTAPFTAGGDYNADGDNLDYPNVTSYDMNRSHEAYLNGVFSPGQFTAPTPGTNGNEKPQQFRQPGFSEVDLAAFKNTRLTGRLNVPDPLRVLQPVQLRQPVSRQRPVDGRLRQGDQPAAAAMVADSESRLTF